MSEAPVVRRIRDLDEVALLLTESVAKVVEVFPPDQSNLVVFELELTDPLGSQAILGAFAAGDWTTNARAFADMARHVRRLVRKAREGR